jgi:hypothetical protein
MLVLACGGDDEEEEQKPAGQPGTTNEQGAVAATQGTIQAVSSLTGSDAANSGTSSANLLGSAAQQTQSIVQPAAGGQGQSQTQSLGELVNLNGFRPQNTPPGYSGTCECTETSCTFTACKGPNISIDGTYSWGGGKLVAKGLKYTLTGIGGGASVDATWTLDCDMAITATSIDGTFATTGTTKSTAGNYTVEASWDNKLTFKQVTFPAGGGAPTGGSEHVVGSYSIIVNGQPQVYSGDFEVKFPQ